MFTVSRLADYKRIDLLVRAMGHVKSPVRLVIAGTGPEYARIRDMASDDPRIELLGYRSDSQLEDLYSRALAVAFVPYQEDYGLVALEGMKAGRPVITTLDAGGPTELVRDGNNGLVVPAEPEALAQAIDFLATNPDDAARFGRNGMQQASSITWGNVLSGLLQTDNSDGTPAGPAWGARMLPQLVVVTTFPIFPPRHGGQARVFQLYRHLARWFDITIVSTVPAGQRFLERNIAPGLREIRVPKSWAHQELEDELREELGVPIDDISALAFWNRSPRIVETVRSTCDGAIAVIACHPFYHDLIREVTTIPLWYEAQDVEVLIKQDILPRTEAARAWIDKVRTAEAACCNEAEVILSCSKTDALSLQRLYGVAPEKFIIAPNGTDLGAINFMSPRAREHLRTRMLGTNDLPPMILFMGSGHQPNLEAAQEVFKIAYQLPNYSFPIMGSCCSAFNPAMKPANVIFLGELSETERLIALEMVDIAVNPMLSGSGTNLKMVDFLAAGLPTVTTPTGARGLDLEDGEHCLVREIADFPATLKHLVNNVPLREKLSSTGHRFAAARYDWVSIATDVFERLPYQTTTARSVVF